MKAVKIKKAGGTEVLELQDITRNKINIGNFFTTNLH